MVAKESDIQCDEAQEDEYYTVQKCNLCDDYVKMEVMELLMHLEDPIICKVCKRKDAYLNEG